MPTRPLSEWLQIMIAEIARKRDDLQQMRAESERRSAETPRPAPAPEPRGPG